MDLARAMGQLGGQRITYELGDWPDTVAKLEEGSLDVVPMFVSDSRAERFAFSSPFYVITHSIYAAEGNAPVHTIDELAGSRVAMEDRSFALQQFQESGIRIVPVLTANTLDALVAVQQGQADYAVLATPSASTLIKDRGIKLRRLGPPFWPRPYAFAVRRDRTDLSAWVQNAFESAIAEGAYESVYEKWRRDLPDSGLASASETPAWLLALGGATILLFGAFVRLRQRRRHPEEEADRPRQLPHTRYQDSREGQPALPRADRFIDRVDQMIKEPRGDAGDGPPYEMLVLELSELSGAAYALDRNYSDRPVRDVLSRLESVSRGPVGYLGRGLFAIYSTRENVRELSDLVLTSPTEGEHSTDTRLVSGSALFPEHGRSAIELIACAEAALQVGRSTGRRWIRYSPSMKPNRSDLEIVQCFRAKKLDGLYPVFQPKLDLATDTITGAEALVRWNHPTLGMIPAARLISLAEKSGFISLITERMIGEAVRFSSTLRSEGLPSSISVNISISDLVETDLPALIRKALEKHGGKPADLNLELTETSVSDDVEHTKSSLDQLQRLGVRLSVDDFGTGFSSLSYLSFFPIDEVKIDRSFVVDMVTNWRNQSIVRSTILMAKELGLKTVAEGVEDSDTQAMLAAIGCDQLQGYVFSKPLPAHDYHQLLLSSMDNRSASRSEGGKNA